MGALLDRAWHSFAALASAKRGAGTIADGPEGNAPGAARDPYAPQRSERLRELEEAGKCLARSGKHSNLRYWPAECGSRVLLEHRRQRQRRSAPNA